MTVSRRWGGCWTLICPCVQSDIVCPGIAERCSIITAEQHDLVVHRIVCHSMKPSCARRRWRSWIIPCTRARIICPGLSVVHSIKATEHYGFVIVGIIHHCMTFSRRWRGSRCLLPPHLRIHQSVNSTFGTHETETLLSISH